MNLLITADYDEKYLNILKEHFDKVERAGWGVTGYVMDEEKLIEKLQGINVIIVGYEEINEKVLDNSDLKFISSIRGGPEANIDIEAATERGIPVTYTLGRTKHSVADHTMGLLLSLVRYIPESNRQLKGRELTSKADQKSETDVIWTMEPGSPYDKFRGPELHTLTMGIIGFGEIGEEVAKRANGFGMDVIAYDPFVDQTTASEFKTTMVSKDDLFKKADVVSVHCRVNEQTKNLVGKKEIDLMKEGSIFINTARASITEKEPLYKAILDGKIRFAGLDVYHKEPLEPNDPLLELEDSRAVLTPHIAGASEDIIHHHSEMVTEEVLRFIDGREPEVVANPEVFK